MQGEKDTMSGVKSEREFQSALSRLVAERRRYAARGALSILIAAALGASAILIPAARAFDGARFFPLAAFVLFWGTIALAAALAVRLSLRSFGGERSLAGFIDRRSGGGSLVAAAREFSKGGERLREYSPYLLSATVARAAERLRSLDPRDLFAEAGAPGWTAAGVLLGVLVAAEAALLPQDGARLLSGIASPGLALRSPGEYNLVVLSGDRAVLPGESVALEALNFGAGRGDADLLTSAVPGVWKRYRIRGEPVGEGGVRMSVYRRVVAEVRDDFSYAFAAAGRRTREHRVRVMHRPVVNALRAIVRYPAYARAKPDTIAPLAGKISALSGSTVELEGETSAPVARASLRFASGAEIALRSRPGGFTGSFRVAADDTFEVALVDSAGLAGERAVRYPVAMLEDGLPSIEILAPEDKARLPRTLEAEILFRASDDYGLARVDLAFLREGKDERWTRTPLPLAGAAAGEQLTDYTGRHAWSLADAGVLPGDRILYYLEAADGNVTTGPGRARTETRSLVVPSAAEIFARIHEEETAQRENLEDALDRGTEIRDRLNKLSDELKSEGKLDWSRSRESREILERQRELKEKMREIVSRLDRGLDDMERNRAVSRDIGRKIEQIRDLLADVENKDLRALVENLQKLMSQVSPKDLMSAMNDVQLDGERLVQNLDRTIELLKQVLREQKLDELARRVDEMLKEQSAVRDSTPSGDTGELAKRQRDLGAESKDVEKSLRDFTAEERDASLASELERMLDELKEKALEEQMRQAAEELSKGDRSAAQCSQSKAMDGLLSLYTSLGRCQQSMGMALERETIERLARSARELVEVSKLQEALGPRLHGRFGRAESERLIGDEIVVKEALRRIADNLTQTARMSMMLSPRVLITLGAAERDVDLALRSIEEEERGLAASASDAAYRSINLAAIELLRATSSAGGSRSGGRQMLQQLMQQQMAIGEELKRLLQGRGGGGWTMEERAAMARLAGEQRAMEELVKQIAEESAGTGEIMGRLDDVTKQMERLAKELEEGSLTNELVERHERILTRMLESQRSTRERDYKRERTSTAAGDVKALAPEAWSEDGSRGEALLRMIRRAMQERGPAEYEDLLRRYFRALSEKAREGE